MDEQTHGDGELALRGQEVGLSERTRESRVIKRNLAFQRDMSTASVIEEITEHSFSGKSTSLDVRTHDWPPAPPMRIAQGVLPSRYLGVQSTSNRSTASDRSTEYRRKFFKHLLATRRLSQCLWLFWDIWNLCCMLSLRTQERLKASSSIVRCERCFGPTKRRVGWRLIQFPLNRVVTVLLKRLEAPRGGISILLS